MANYSTTQDILLDVLWRAFEVTDGSSQYKDAALRYINRAYRSIWTGGKEFMPAAVDNWWWLRRQAQITMLPAITTGSIAVTQNSTIATLSSAPTVSVAGYLLLVTGSNSMAFISAHTAGDIGLTLDSVWTGDTATAASYVLAPIDYNLPSDCLNIIDPMTCHADSGVRVYGADLAEMWDAYPPVAIAAGTPKFYAQTDEDTIRFSHYQNDYLRLDYFYRYKPADLEDDASSVPVIPLQYRHVLADAAAFFALTDKEDSKAPGIGAQAKAGMAAMASDQRKRMADTGEMGSIKQRPTLVYRMFRRTASGLRVW